MSGLSVLLVGGNGFLGRHAAVALADAASSIAILDRSGSDDSPPVGAPSLPEGCSQYSGSVANVDDVTEAVAATRPDVIVSLAAFGLGDLGLVPAAERDPRAAVVVNSIGLLNILEVAAARGGVRVVWASSTTVYGEAERYPSTVDEEALVCPRNVYAATKVLGEQLLRSYRSSRQVEAVAMRPTLVWGPGIRYRGVQAGLGDMIEAAASGKSITIRDPNEVWDLLYVQDAGGAIAWLAHSPPPAAVVLVNGYRASIHDVRGAVMAARPSARIDLTDGGPRLGYPRVDDRLARGMGFVPAYDLDGSVSDYLATAEAGFDSDRRASA